MPLLPLGILSFLIDLRISPTVEHIGSYLLLGWLFYLGLTVILLLSRNRLLFWAFYIGLLYGLQQLNVIGCHTISHERLF